MIRRIILVCCMIFGLHGLVFAKDTISVRTTQSKKIVTIGETFSYCLDISVPQTTQIREPVFNDTVGDFRVRKAFVRSGKWFGIRTLKINLLLDTYVTGKRMLPVIELEYKESNSKDWLKKEIPGLEITVRSLLEEAGITAQLKNIKPPLPLPGWWIPWVLLAIAIVLLCIGLIVWNKIHKPQTLVSPEEIQSPWDSALRQLDALKEKQFIENGFLKEYYSGLSGIIREYLEKRFAISAPEMTSEEFLQFAQKSSALTSDQRLKLHQFLQDCDLVKFAKFKPEMNETQKAHESARTFIQETKQ